MKKFIMFITIMISLLLTTNVYAKDCKYHFYSSQYGEVYMTMHINGSEVTSTINTMNNYISYDNGEDNVKDWDYNQYKSKNEVCPYYALVETSGNATVRVGYDHSKLKSIQKDIWDEREAHICVSETIEEDKKKNGEAYNKSTDYYIQDESYLEQTHKDKTVKLTCTYNSDSEETKKYGFSGGFLKIYTDGSYDSVVTNYRGDEGGHNTFNSDDWVDKVKFKGGASLSSCPYYMIADFDGFNSVEFSNVREYTQGDRQVMISTTIDKDKPDYDEEKDGKATTPEEQDERARKAAANHENKSSLNDDYDPGNMYSDMVIGDKFCEQEETMTALKALGLFIIIAKFAVPMIIIIIGIIDMVSAVQAGTEDKLKGQAMILGKRVVLGLFIMFGPTILNAFLSQLNQYQLISDDINQCQNCLLQPFTKGKCSTKGNENNVTIDPTGTKSASADKLQTTKDGSADPLETSKDASADKLENGKGGSADKLNDGKSGSADKLNNGKDGSADKIGNNNNVSTGEINNNNNVTVGDINNSKDASVDPTTNPRNNVNVSRINSTRNN